MVSDTFVNTFTNKYPKDLRKIAKNLKLFGEQLDTMSSTGITKNKYISVF